jgi:hypothetical protein
LSGRSWAFATGLLVVVALAAGSLASARPSASDARFRCGVKAIDIYFWPQGHGVLSAYPFPAYRPAHVAVYEKGRTTRRAFLLFVTEGSRIVARGCRAAGDKAATRWDGGPIKLVKKARRIRCSFPTKVQLRAVPVVGGQRFVVAFGHTTRSVAFADIKRRRSTLVYDRRYCRDVAVPGVR